MSAVAPAYTSAPSLLEVVRQVRHIPPAPRILPPLKRLLLNGDSAISEIVALIRLDPGLAARVLQMGNSIFYNRGQRCHTIDEAIGRVGFEQIYRLVSDAVAAQVLIRPVLVYSLESDDLWRLSVGRALAAEIIAATLQLDRDVAYTAGLLHGIGRIAIDEWALRHRPELRLDPGCLPLESSATEQAVLGFDHAAVGAGMLKEWNYPAEMSAPIHWQYQPLAEPARRPITSALYLAKYLHASVCLPTAEIPSPDPAVLAQLDFAPAAFAHAAATLRLRLRDVHTLLRPDPPATTHLQFPGGSRRIPDLVDQRVTAS